MSLDQNMLDDIDTQRSENGFLTLGETMKLSESGNTVLDPFSTLISMHAKIGSNNVFYPNVTVLADNKDVVTIKDHNIFYPMTYMEATGGVIEIGSHNQFGPEDGVTIKANGPDTFISIGNYGRYLSGATFLGKSTLGNGSQVLGSITIENCILEQGGSFKEVNPDLRAAVIKGRGLIRNRTINKGDVAVLGEPLPEVIIQKQSDFHPQKP